MRVDLHTYLYDTLSNNEGCIYVFTHGFYYYNSWKILTISKFEDFLRMSSGRLMDVQIWSMLWKFIFFTFFGNIWSKIVSHMDVREKSLFNVLWTSSGPLLDVLWTSSGSHFTHWVLMLTSSIIYGNFEILYSLFYIRFSTKRSLAKTIRWNGLVVDHTGLMGVVVGVNYFLNIVK